MSAVEGLLARLDKVKRTGVDRWTARSPLREDRTPSLCIRELADGRILLHDFGGGSVEEILDALGLEWDALFPEKPIDHARRERRPFIASDVLAALADEISLVAVVSCNLKQGMTLSDSDHARLVMAAERIETGRRLA